MRNLISAAKDGTYEIGARMTNKTILPLEKFTPTAVGKFKTDPAVGTSLPQAKGTLDPGMLADLQVYRGDPLDEEGDVDWEQLRPRAVLLGGARVFGTL